MGEEKSKRPKATPGRPLAVIKFKDSSGSRWEFDGALPMLAVSKIIMLAVSDGVRTSAIDGMDIGIAAAFTAIRNNLWKPCE